ncbi:MAG: universal stress protein E [Oceanospirillaceae bacterium]|jgi:universal stress protein E
MMKEHVLVIAYIEDNDFLAIEKARDITLPMNPTLDIIQFIKPSDEPNIHQEEHIKQLSENLSENVQRIFEGTSEVNSDVIVSDNIAEWVAKYCDTTAVDLVIKGGHRSESMFHTPCDFKLMRQIHCPILIASNKTWKTKANVLMAIDLSREDDIHQQLNSSILNWGEKLSKITHNPLHAVYSIPIAKPLLEFDVVEKDAVLHKKGRAAQKKMQQLLEKYDLESVSSHIVAGPPDKSISHEANVLKSDLVVLGYVDHDGLGKLFAGNTAEKVLHFMRTDCLIIKLPAA